MARKNVDIHVGTTADTSGVEKAQESVSDLRQEVEQTEGASGKLKKEMDGAAKATGDLGAQGDVVEALGKKVAEAAKALTAAALVTKAITSAVGAVRDMVAAYGDLIAGGVEYNARLGDAEVGIANVIRQFDGLNKEAAKQEASKAMDAIIAAEPKAAATLDQLVEGFLATFAASKSVGISLEENVDLVARVSNALGNSNIPAAQLAQELRSIVTGTIGHDSALAKILQLTNDQIRQASEAGTLYDTLVERIGSLGEAGDTSSVRLSTLQSQLAAVGGEIAEPAFDVWRDSLVALQETIAGNPEMVDALKAMTQLIADLTVGTSQLVGAVTGLSYGRAVEGAKRLSDEMDAQREALREQIAQADTLAEREDVQVALLERHAALTAEVADADGQRREILENQLHFVEMQLGSLHDIAGQVRETSQADAERTKELATQVELTEEQLKRIEAIRATVSDRAFDRLAPEDQVARLNEDLLVTQSRLRDAFREADAQIPGLDATAVEMARIADTAEGPLKLALFEQLEKLSELEVAYERATAAAGKASDAETKAIGAVTSALEMQRLKLVELDELKKRLAAESGKFVDVTSESIGGVKTTQTFRQEDTQTTMGGVVQPVAGAAPATDADLQALRTLEATVATQQQAVADAAKGVDDAVSKLSPEVRQSLDDAGAKLGELPGVVDGFSKTVEANTGKVVEQAAKTQGALDTYGESVAAGFATVEAFAASTSAALNDAVRRIATLESQIRAAR